MTGWRPTRLLPAGGPWAPGLVPRPSQLSALLQGRRPDTRAPGFHEARGRRWCVFLEGLLASKFRGRGEKKEVTLLGTGAGARRARWSPQARD